MRTGFHESPYRRISWQKILNPSDFPTNQRFTSDQVWVPETHLRMRDFLTAFGTQEIEGWTGKETEARMARDEPDPPWLWYEESILPSEYFVISSELVVTPCDKIDALRWWSKIKPSLIEEGADEQAAYERMQDCRNIARNLFSNGQLVAQLLTSSGDFKVIPTESWLSSGGHLFLWKHFGTLLKPHNLHPIEHKGLVVVDRNQLEKGLSAQAGADEHGIDTSSEIDKERFPYLSFMIELSKHETFSKSNKTPKKVIEFLIEQSWPKNLGDKSNSKVANMASFLRRPKDEKGGLGS